MTLRMTNAVGSVWCAAVNSLIVPEDRIMTDRVHPPAEPASGRGGGREGHSQRDRERVSESALCPLGLPHRQAGAHPSDLI